MILFNDSARWDKIPLWFASKQVEEARRHVRAHFMLDADVRAQTDIPPVWKLRMGAPLNVPLGNLSNGRCAFCEQDVSLMPYRFRPPAHAQPGDTPADDQSYLWRAFHWGNFYPICTACRPSNQSYFPVDGAREPVPHSVDDPIYTGRVDAPAQEHAFLYHPGEVSAPSRAFRQDCGGRLYSLNARAEATIEHFALNRQSLVDARRAVIAQEIAKIRALAGSAPGGEAQTFTFDRGAPLGGTAYLFLHRVMNLAGKKLSLRGSLSLARISGALTRWARDPRFAQTMLEMAEEVHKIDSTSSNELMRELLLTRQPASDSDLEPPAGETASAGPVPDDPDHARIHTVTIHNFKSLEDIAFALPKALPPSAPCLLILGENATGKSSILEAIALACIGDDLRDALRRAPVGLNARHITLNPEYMGAVEQDPRDCAKVTVAFHPPEDGAARTLGITVRHAEAANVPDGGFAPFGDTDAARPMVFAYGPNRLYGHEPRPDHTRFIDTLFDSTLHVSNPEEWLISLADRKDDALNQIAKALRHIIRIDGEFGTIEIAPDPEDGKPRAWINLIRHLPDGGTRTLRQRLAFASSGYRAVLALVCDVCARLLAQDVTPYEARLSRAIILIDEIEAHLHPRWKLQIIDGLRKALPRATFILTSHDPLCVRGMRAGEVMMLNRHMAAEGPIPEKVERIGDFGAFERMTVEQLLTSDMFQLASVDDPKAEQRYARIADLIAAREDGAALSDEDVRTLSAFNAEIVEGMPTGVTEISNLVQRAVADYMKERRAAETARNTARDTAEAAVKDFLRELLA